MKNYRSLVRRSTFSALIFGFGYAGYQIKTTINILNNTLNLEAIEYFEKNKINSRKIAEYVPQYFKIEKTLSTFDRFWGNLIFSYAQRLLNIAKCDNRALRLKAIEALAKIHSLDDWQMEILALSLDARTAIGLARIPGVDIRFFTLPPHNCVHENLANWMKHFMLQLSEIGNHPCLEYFVKKQYVSLQEVGRMVEHDITSTEVAQTYLHLKREPLPLCVESLLHHSTIGNHGRDIVTMDGLPLLMEVYKKYKDNRDVVISLVKLISNISTYPELLHEIYRSGWIGVLAKMLKSDDLRISGPAAKILINLDTDDICCNAGRFMRRTYLLHPIHRGHVKSDVDVILVHGLLGGVFFTWRQRDFKVTELDKKQPEVNIKVEKKTSSDPRTREYLNQMEKLQQEEWDDLGSDYEFVLTDLPRCIDSDGPFIIPGEKICKTEMTNQKSTQCWPKDWLVKDCSDLRILGINYDSSLSMWSPMCPQEKIDHKTLTKRSQEFLEELSNVGVGKRPIIWLTHSMGGLLVKSMLTQAFENQNEAIQNISKNTKGIVFFSTPHLGSHIAAINQTASLFLWPSVEVRELKQGSYGLLALHEKFLHLLKNINVKILSFVETEKTIISPLKLNITLVPKESAKLNIGENFEVPLDHLRICKPINRHSFLYQKVLTFIQDIKNENIRKTKN